MDLLKEYTEMDATNSTMNNKCRFCYTNMHHTSSHDQDYDRSQANMYLIMLEGTFNIEVTNKENNIVCKQCMNLIQTCYDFKHIVLSSETKLQTESKNERLEKIDEDQIYKTIEKKDCTIDETNMDETHDQHSDIDSELQSLDDYKSGMKHDFGNVPHERNKNERTELPNKTPSDRNVTKLLERRGNGPILRQNTLKLIENSTLCVFQWNKSLYRCFCCKQPFSDMEKLREHTNKHTLKDIEKEIIIQQNKLVKVEVSLINCKICLNPCRDLVYLKRHLVEHGVNFLSQDNLLVPFKLENELKCQMCHEKFSVFRHLNIHMNTHFRKEICHICGAGFSNLVFLNLHKSRAHKTYKCDVCNMEFSDKNLKIKHDIENHGLKPVKKLRFPCQFCNERFCQENLKILHLVKEHGVPKPAHNCDMCLKQFITKSLRNNHVKNVHLKQRRSQCDICHLLFYTQSDVKRHKVTHTGEKNFACSICESVFATKDSLRRHRKRTHHGCIS